MSVDLSKLSDHLKIIRKDELTAIIFDLIKSKTLSFTDFTKIYVSYLEEKDDDNKDLICELGYSLVQYKDAETAGTKEQLELKANKAIIASGLFSGTGYEKKLIDKINNQNGTM